MQWDEYSTVFFFGSSVIKSSCTVRRPQWERLYPREWHWTEKGCVCVWKDLKIKRWQVDRERPENKEMGIGKGKFNLLAALPSRYRRITTNDHFVKRHVEKRRPVTVHLYWMFECGQSNLFTVMVLSLWTFFMIRINEAVYTCTQHPSKSPYICYSSVTYFCYNMTRFEFHPGIHTSHDDHTLTCMSCHFKGRFVLACCF